VVTGTLISGSVGPAMKWNYSARRAAARARRTVRRKNRGARDTGTADGGEPCGIEHTALQRGMVLRPRENSGRRAGSTSGWSCCVPREK